MGCTYALKWQISPNSTRTLKIFAKEVQFLQAVDEKQDWFVREIYGDKQQWFRPPLKQPTDMWGAGGDPSIHPLTDILSS